jgi:predicted CopG family antitoxin
MGNGRKKKTWSERLAIVGAEVDQEIEKLKTEIAEAEKTERETRANRKPER